MLIGQDISGGIPFVAAPKEEAFCHIVILLHTYKQIM